MLSQLLGASRRIFNTRTSLLGLRQHRLNALYASGVLLFGVWGYTYFLATSSIIYLEGEDSPRRRIRPEGRELLSAVSSLQRQKLLDQFGPKHTVDIDKELRKHEQSHITDPATGISRYDIIQFARYV